MGEPAQPESDRRRSGLQSGWQQTVTRVPHMGTVMGKVAEHAPRMGRHVGRHASVHRMTLVALAGAACIIWLVPQVKALFRWPGDALEWAALIFSGSAALALQAVGWLCVLPIHDIRTLDEKLLGDPQGRPARWHARLEPVGRSLDAMLAYFADRPRGAALILATVSIASGWWSQLTPLIVHAALWSGWLLAQRFSDELLALVLAPPASRLAASRLLGRGITVVLLTNTVLEVLWIAQDVLPEGLRYRVYSTWAILQTLFAIALVLRVIDVLGLLALPLIRVWPLALLLLALAAIPGGVAVGARQQAGGPLRGHASAQASAMPHAMKEDNAWFEQLVARIEEIPADQPVLFVAASGGGSRAAITAALVYEQLAHTEIGGGRTLGDNVLLVSSVSGGSLATGYFLTHPHAPLKELARESAREAAHLDPRSSVFVREMANDFMAPLLRGVLNLRQERGEAVASFWRDRYQWQKITSSGVRAARRPLAVFNATHVQTGSRVGFGIPALPAKLLAPSFTAKELDAGLEIDLADAVRMSANFPYGFEHVVLAPNQAGIQPEIIDGGLVDNTGLDTLVLLLENVQAATTAPVPENAPPDDPMRQRRALSQRARNALLQRGMLVLEIDAGARPSNPNWLAMRFPSLSKPLEALGRAGHQNSGALRTTHLNRLRNAFPENGKAAVVGVVRAGFDCNSQGDVITAWALDHEARTQIYEEYAQTEGRLSRTLAIQYKAIQRLQQPRPTGVAAPTAALLEMEATNLRAIYDDYIDRAMGTDAEQHGSAPDCRPPADAKKPGPAEAALSEALQRSTEELIASATANEPDEVAQPAGGLDGSGDSDAVVGGSEPPAPSPAEQTKAENAASAALGWVYVGQRDGSKWQTKYMKWKNGGLPKRGDLVQLATSSNVRTSLPDAEGRLAPARLVLPASAELKVLETRSWGGTNFVWARVAVPQDTEAQVASETPVPAAAAE